MMFALPSGARPGTKVDPRSGLHLHIEKHPSETGISTACVTHFGAVLLRATHSTVLDACFVRFSVNESAAPHLCVIHWDPVHVSSLHQLASGWICTSYDTRSMQRVSVSLGDLVPTSATPFAGGLLIRGSSTSSEASLSASASSGFWPQETMVNGELCAAASDARWMATPLAMYPVYVSIACGSRTLGMDIVAEAAVDFTRCLISVVDHGAVPNQRDFATEHSSRLAVCATTSGTLRIANATPDAALGILVWTWLSETHVVTNWHVGEDDQREACSAPQQRIGGCVVANEYLDPDNHLAAWKLIVLLHNSLNNNIHRVACPLLEVSRGSISVVDAHTEFVTIGDEVVNCAAPFTVNLLSETTVTAATTSFVVFLQTDDRRREFNLVLLNGKGLEVSESVAANAKLEGLSCGGEVDSPQVALVDHWGHDFIVAVDERTYHVTLPRIDACELTRLALESLDAALPPSFFADLLGSLVAETWRRAGESAAAKWSTPWTALAEQLLERTGCSTATPSDCAAHSGVDAGVVAENFCDPMLISIDQHAVGFGSGGTAAPAASRCPAQHQFQPSITGLCVVALHLLLEACKLRRSLWRFMRPLGLVLLPMSAHLGWTRYAAAYSMQFCIDEDAYPVTVASPSFSTLFKETISEEQLHAAFVNADTLINGMPPDIHHTLRLAVEGGVRHIGWAAPRRLANPAHPVHLTTALFQLYIDAFDDQRNLPTTTSQQQQHQSDYWWRRLVEGLQDHPVLAAPEYLADSVCAGTINPLTHAMIVARESPPEEWDAPLLHAIGRLDKAGIPRGGSSGNDVVRTARDRAIGRLYAKMLEDDDGVSVDATLAKHWGDARLEVVQSMLSSAAPVQLQTRSDGSDQLQGVLKGVTRRTLALGIGRGMITCATQNFRVRDMIPIPPLNLDGRTTDGLTITNDLPQSSPESLIWPLFHNGVAAGLRFLPLPTSRAVNRHWITHQTRDMENRPERAGLVLAVGLLGHLRAVQVTDIYALLVGQSAPQDTSREPTFIAVLLGLCCSFRGTCNDHVMRSLSVHLQALTPGADDLDVVIDVQTCALVALGLLFEGSCNSFHVELLLGEISRRPSDEHCVGREGHALAAGIGLGFVLLGRGRNHGLRDVEDRLLQFMVGARRDAARPRIDGLAEFNEMVVDDGHFLTRALLARTCDPPDVPCNKVMEGDFYNTAVTGPASIMALGLMFLRTNDALMAAKLAPDNALRALQSTAPEMLHLRVMFAATTMWNSIAPTRAWLMGAVPSELRALATKPGVDLESPITKYHLMNLGHGIAGAVMAMGLRFVGSMNADARDVVLGELAGFADGKIGTTKIVIGQLQRTSGAFDSCLASCAVALGLIMAGTGDTQCSAILRRLYKRTNASFGDHLAVSMALGMLFLGSGRLTLSNTTESIAALVVSLYPVWPRSPSDNKFHHQALRHLYATTVVPRLMETIDVATNRPVSVSVRVVMRSGRIEGDEASRGVDRTWTPLPSERLETAVAMVTPSLLPDPSTIDRIEVRAVGYHPLTVFNNGQLGDNGCVIGVLAKSRRGIEQVAGARAEQSAEESLVVDALRALHASTASAASSMLLPCEHSLVLIDNFNIMLALYNRFYKGPTAPTGVFSLDFVANIKRTLDRMLAPAFAVKDGAAAAAVHPMRAALMQRWAPTKVARALVGTTSADALDPTPYMAKIHTCGGSERALAVWITQAIQYLGLGDISLVPVAMHMNRATLQSRKCRVLAMPKLFLALRLPPSLVDDVVACCVDYAETDADSEGAVSSS